MSGSKFFTFRFPLLLFFRTFAPAFKATRCSAVGSVPGLGPGCRRFESCHLDSSSTNRPILFISYRSVSFISLDGIRYLMKLPRSGAAHSEFRRRQQKS